VAIDSTLTQHYFYYVGDCELAEIEIEETYVQLLQLSDYVKTSVQQCKIEVDCIILYCSIHSHIFAVQKGHKIYLQTLSNTAYQQLHETYILSLEGNAIISGASPNITITSIYFAGSTTMDRCYFGT